MKLLLVKTGRDTTLHPLKEHLVMACYYESEQYYEFLNIVFCIYFQKTFCLAVNRFCTLPTYVHKLLVDNVL